MSSYGKDSAELEIEVEAQRQRIEDRIGEIKERLSPGQIVDELLSYTKNGGQHFAANLGQTVANNPLPAALLGISLVWLMSGQGPKLSMPHGESAPQRSEPDYPYATVTGGLRRVSHAEDGSGKWYSEFEDTTGRRYKAESNALGERAGAFMDNAGRKFGGFIDEAGLRVRDFQDEAGNRLDEAAGWASHRWHDMQKGVSHALDQVGQQAQQLGGAAQHQVDRTSRMIMDSFQNQPLVAGALAFAAGAALGAALPHTKQEDQTVGKLGDKVRSKAAEVTSDLYEEGKSRAADLYERGKEGAADLYDDLREQKRAPEIH
ncbi:MAG: hypothetical protein JWQ89_925 [Devosia sp.]|uniref:DUF3618 domain-containing protein n=1 Tax=Devosia sp. TaxID=1871048 RepID=UPI00260AB81D|nr:DUF3618 domain-containing protein [Devosia sp.]MDB5539198.1 hypothetical protein [Devosia sp.]